MEIKNLEKRYGKKLILDDVTVDFGWGVYGIVGENGAGKTTLFRCITGLIQDYKGEINIPAGEKLNYLPQSFGMPEELNVWDVLEYISLLRDKKGADKDELEYLLKLLNLYEQRSKKVRALSGGMLRRLGIVQAFMGKREIVILDEPTAGLDPEERLRFKRALGELGKDRLILLSTHLLTDVEDVCEKVVVLHQGRICFQGSVEELKYIAYGKVYEIPSEELSGLGENIFVIRIENSSENAVRVISGDRLNYHEKSPTVEDGYLCVVKEI